VLGTFRACLAVGGADDPGDDHVYHNQQFSKFIEGIPEAKDGKVELFINGDFLEFAQVRPDVYTLGSSKYWCSEAESLEKLAAITKGHEDVFDALKRFQADGNRVTLAAGNHDVDLYWPRVQDELRKVGGPIAFATGSANYFRYDNRLMIGHGHMIEAGTNPLVALGVGNNSGAAMMDIGNLVRIELANNGDFQIQMVELYAKCVILTRPLRLWNRICRLKATCSSFSRK